jgi:hypothetical protein
MLQRSNKNRILGGSLNGEIFIFHRQEVSFTRGLVVPQKICGSTDHLMATVVFFHLRM